MKSMLITVAALAAGFAVPASNAWAQVGTGRAAADAASQPYCFYQDQKFSEGAVLNGRVCTHGDATGKAGKWTWMPQEKAESSGIQQELERTRLQTQLMQARSMLAEMEAHYHEATAKLSGKN
jgi:hypothetical protein